METVGVVVSLLRTPVMHDLEDVQNRNRKDLQGIYGGSRRVYGILHTFQPCTLNLSSHNSDQTKTATNPKPGLIWVVLSIRVPFWVPNIVRRPYTKDPKGGL